MNQATSISADQWLPSGMWYGQLNGTLSGNLFLQITDGDQPLVIARTNLGGELVVGVGTLRVEGSLEVRLTPPNSGSATQGDGYADVVFLEVTPARLRGRWSTPEGHAGVFIVVPGEPVQAAPEREQPAQHPPAPDDETAPLQMIQRTGRLPKLQLFRDDVKELADLIKHLLPTPFEVVFAADVNGEEVRRIGNHFWSLPALPTRTAIMSLSLTEPGSALVRSINVTFSADNSSFVVSGPDDVWVAGTFRKLETVLASKYGRWRWPIEKYALNINGLFLLATLAYLPELTLGQRLAALTAVVGVAALFKLAYDAVTTVRVYLKTDKKDGRLFELPRYITALANALTWALLGWMMLQVSERTLKEWLLRLLSPTD
ncbi:hypothetical protein [Rhizobium sp. SGZ-381]|uniref:hypothetical protein n=1 Tax=Rhizobium sp. SGZ-381 TaxID=3342800 RepID=UPI0036710A89